MRILVSDIDWEGLDVEREILASDDVDLAVAPSPDREALLAAIADADILLVCFAVIDEDVLRAAPRLRAIIRYGGGTNNIDLDQARRQDIAVYNVPDASTEEVADHALLLLLSLSRGLERQILTVRNGGWTISDLLPVRSRGMTLGLVGFGRTAQALASRCLSLGMTVLYSDSSRTPPPEIPAEHCSSRADLLARADVVSLHVPLTDDTRGLVNAEAFEAMKPSAILINVARGGLVDTDALVAALERGEIAAAGLDVTNPEPLGEDHPLRQMHNVLITPHTAYRSAQSLREVRQRVAQAAQAISRDQAPPSHIVGQVV